MSKIVIAVWDCVCEKCSHSWITKSELTPRICPKCKSIKWNNQNAPQATKQSKPIYITHIQTEKHAQTPSIEQTNVYQDSDLTVDLDFTFD